MAVKRLKITCPLFVDLPRKRTNSHRRVHLNMNSYGNVNTHVNNEAKKHVLELLSDQLEGVKLDTPVNVTYRVFKPSKRRLDKMNVVAVVSKYVLDAISHFECWDDDNDDIVKKEVILPTIHDKNKGRVEILITKASISE